MNAIKKCTVLCLCFLLFSVAQAQEKVKPSKIKKVVVTEETFEKGVAGKPKLDSETSYDASGNIIEELNYKDGVFDIHCKYEYDANGNKYKTTEFDKNGNVDKIIVYKFEKGLKTEKAVYDKNQKLKSKKTYKYELY